MPKALIKVSYRQVIDATATGSFEKNVLHASFEEYKLKQQTYNTDGAIKTFTALKAKDGRANSLHYKSGFAAAGFIDGLKNTIVILQDDIEMPFCFETYRFEVLESHIDNEQVHKVAIHYISGTLSLYEIINEYLLVAKDDKTQAPSGQSVDTWLIKVQPGMSIVNYTVLHR